MEIFLIAFALSMDSVALSMANGAKCLNFKIYQILKISFFYAFFQAIMPLIGYFLGSSFTEFISEIDHFIAFFILVFLGFKMIKDSRNLDSECGLNLTNKELVIGAIATSIDAMAVGVTFAFEEINIVSAALVIGATCFVLCVMACFIGKKLGEALESKALVLGGVILILIGFKILITHLGLLG
ncbi:manganese efflux pump MntP family protein [Campylobacter geochelonis]|uniref:Putative manganese efflux pump MntP n=1 Tax=Campylobacter geochelonis TaxID=1780362 RepID=A0A128EPQ1_9BACT|nr:manganese efflux pump MntP family protein [Campylobacter geochelonis]QKF70483.1 manganese efflux pump MntP [Campylobacter geochelonis]CZE46192.1 membrane protein [Campylobacter geochelonis]CZE46439.1 membrane protein [Campylobacter geochelonis]CZE50475.1 membrane protein [Campylobacter geochelonis]